MIQCPKCGFEQPEDRFCAKCGIVMERFKKERPSGAGLTGTPTFLLALGLIIILFAGGYFLYKSQTTEQFESTQAPAPVAPPAAMNAQPAVVEAQSTGAQKTRAPNPAPAANGNPVKNAPMSGTAFTGTAPVVGALTAEGRTEQNSVQIEFALVSREALDKLTSDGEGRAEIGRYSYALVPNFKSKSQVSKSDPGFKSLASETRNLTLNQPTLVFRGGKEPRSNETIGFFVDLTPVQATDRGAQYKLSIKRSLPDVQPSGELKITTQNFDENVNFTHGSALVVAGLLPRKQIVPGEDELYKTNILRALLEQSFQRGDDEFVIIIQPHFSEPSN